MSLRTPPEIPASERRRRVKATGSGPTLAFRRLELTDAARVMDKFRWIRTHSADTATAIESAMEEQIRRIARANDITAPEFPSALPPDLAAALAQELAHLRSDRGQQMTAAEEQDQHEAITVDAALRSIPPKRRHAIARLIVACSPTPALQRTAYDHIGGDDDDRKLVAMLKNALELAVEAAHAAEGIDGERTDRAVMTQWADRNRRVARILATVAIERPLPINSGTVAEYAPDVKRAVLIGAYDRLTPTDRALVLAYALGIEAHRQNDPRPLGAAIRHFLRTECGLEELTYFAHTACAMLAKWAAAAGATRPAFPKAGRPRKAKTP
jgi:hypothetical protein